MLKQGEGCIGGQGGEIASPRGKDHIVGKIALDRRDGDTGGIVCHLHRRIDDTGVVLTVFMGGHKIHTVGEVIECFGIHIFSSLKLM